jgi:hypothetical protein
VPELSEQPFSWAAALQCNTVLHGLLPIVLGLLVMFVCRFIPGAESVFNVALGLTIAGLMAIGGRSIQAAVSKEGFK